MALQTSAGKKCNVATGCWGLDAPCRWGETRKAARAPLLPACTLGPAARTSAWPGIALLGCTLAPHPSMLPERQLGLCNSWR